jgi:hypothetical protein
LTPYTLSPRATAASIVARDACTTARDSAAIATGAPLRATATTSAIERERPSMVMVDGMPPRSYVAVGDDAKRVWVAYRCGRRDRGELTSLWIG